MQSGTTDEAIFGSPETCQFDCLPGVLAKRFGLLPTDGGNQIVRSAWPSANRDTSFFGVQSADGVAMPPSCVSANALSEPIASGDDDDILGLISSSLDRFNAQLHHDQQTNGLAHTSQGDTNSNALGPRMSVNFADSVSSTWTTTTQTLQQSVLQNLQSQKHNTHDLSSYSALPTSFTSASSNVFPDSSNMSSVVGQGPSFGFPSQQTPPLGALDMQTSARKLRNLPHTLSEREESSFLWESQVKTISSEMGMLSVDSGIGADCLRSPNWFPSHYTNAINSNSTNATFFGGSPIEGLPSSSPSQESTGGNSSNPMRFDFLNATVLDTTTTLATIALAVSSASAQQQHRQQPRFTGDPVTCPSLLWPHVLSSGSQTEQRIPPEDTALRTNSYAEATARRWQLQQQHQQQSGIPCDLSSFSSTTLNPALISSISSSTVPSTAMTNSLTGDAGRLGSLFHMELSPPQSLSNGGRNPHQSAPALDFHQCAVTNVVAKSGPGVLGAPKATRSRGIGPCQSQRIEATPSSSSSVSSSSSSSSSASSSGTSDKPVITKWRRACSFYLRGHCKKEDCEFAHDLTKVTCKFWEVGECFKGLTCPFLHGYPPELLLEEQQSPKGEQLVRSN